MPIFDATFTPPPPIEGLTVSALSGASVSLEWDPTTLAAGDFVEYRIYRSMDGLAYAQIAAIPDPAQTSYEDFTAPLGVPVYYRVTQVNLDGYESAPAEAVAELSGCDWWIVTPGDPSASFELPNCHAYASEWPIQTTEHEPIGRAYKLVESGELLGEQADLTMLLLPEHEAVIRQIRAVALDAGILLKSPHGEVYPVALTTLRRTRLVGNRQEVRIRTVQLGA